MNATRLFFASSFVTALLLASVSRAEAQPFRLNRDRRLDRDLRHIHPWNLYRGHRYSPVMTPSMMTPTMRPIYMINTQSAYPTTGSSQQTMPEDAVFLSTVGQWVGVPQPSGPIKTPPPGAAVIQVHVPAAFAHVLSDGKPTSTEGTDRYFVTPELPDGKTYTYTVSASWKNGGDDVTNERTIEVKAGQTTLVDFTRPDDKKPPKESTLRRSY